MKNIKEKFLLRINFGPEKEEDLKRGCDKWRRGPAGVLPALAAGPTFLSIKWDPAPGAVPAVGDHRPPDRSQRANCLPLGVSAGPATTLEGAGVTEPWVAGMVTRLRVTPSGAQEATVLCLLLGDRGLAWEPGLICTESGGQR